MGFCLWIPFQKHYLSIKFHKPWKKSSGVSGKSLYIEIQFIGYFLFLSYFYLHGDFCAWTNTIGITSIPIPYIWNSVLSWIQIAAVKMFNFFNHQIWQNPLREGQCVVVLDSELSRGWRPRRALHSLQWSKTSVFTQAMTWMCDPKLTKR